MAPKNLTCSLSAKPGLNGWLLIFKAISLGILLFQASCSCINRGPDIFILPQKEDKPLKIEVSQSTLQGGDSRFFITLKNENKKKTIDLADYQLKITSSQSGLFNTGSHIIYTKQQGKEEKPSLDSPIFIEVKELIRKTKIKPGENLSYSDFELSAQSRFDQLTIQLELILKKEKKVTDKKSVTWYEDTYQLSFQGLKNWRGAEVLEFTIKNDSDQEVVDTKHLYLTCESTSGAQMMLGTQSGSKLKDLKLSDLLPPAAQKLDKQAETPLIQLRMDTSNQQISSKVVFSITNKTGRELVTKSAMWYKENITLEGPESFLGKEVTLTLVNQSNGLDPRRIKICATSNVSVTIKINGQVVADKGASLATILGNPGALDKGNYNLPVAIKEVAGTLAVVEFTLRDDANQVLASKKVSEIMITDDLMRKLAGSDTVLGSILLKIKRGDNSIRDQILKWKAIHRAIDQRDVVEKDCLDLLKILLKSGGDRNQKDELGQTPLHLAVKKGFSSVVKELLDNGAPVDAQDTYGDTPFHQKNQKTSKEEAMVAILELLLNKDSSLVIQKGYLGRTPLHCAAMESGRVVKKLLENSQAKEVLNEQDSSGDTALHLAITNGKVSAVQTLCKQPGICLDVVNNKGKTAKQLASCSTNEAIRNCLKNR